MQDTTLNCFAVAPADTIHLVHLSQCTLLTFAADGTALKAWGTCGTEMPHGCRARCSALLNSPGSRFPEGQREHGRDGAAMNLIIFWCEGLTLCVRDPKRFGNGRLPQKKRHTPSNLARRGAALGKARIKTGCYNDNVLQYRGLVMRSSTRPSPDLDFELACEIDGRESAVRVVLGREGFLHVNETLLPPSTTP